MRDMEKAQDTDEVQDRIVAVTSLMQGIAKLTPPQIYTKYQEFFESFMSVCENCRNEQFLAEQYEEIYSSLNLFAECLVEIEKEYQSKIKTCTCCGNRGMYLPLPQYYRDMAKKYGSVRPFKDETCNTEEYLCPKCHCSDRDRLIVTFFKKAGLEQAKEGDRVLQIAPAPIIDQWIKIYCPQLQYDTTDLYMEGVTFKSDIQDMQEVADETYDLIICSHVLEHVKDDRKALAEMKRILKPAGKLVFLVPIDLNMAGIDEEWGLSEAENWRRFAQGDHCRRYGKAGLLERLKEQFYVHSLDKDYFGEEIFRECGLTDTSTLYVLTKDVRVSLELSYEPEIDEELCKNGPLVSVLLPCYNHEKYVRRAIESVINQSYKNIEFLVADDGSTDATPEIMKEYEQYYAKSWYFEKNASGRSVFLLKQAAGKYVALMHSDDIWDVNKLALQVKYMETHEQCGVCLSWCDFVDDNGERLNMNVFRQKNRSQHEWMRYFWEYGNALANPSHLTRRIPYSECQTHGVWCRQLPDYFKWVDTVQQCEIHIMQRSLVKMTWHTTGKNPNTSANNPENGLRHSIENAMHWLFVIRDMNKDFFKQSFYEYMKNKDADSEQEIMCEKCFLLLGAPDIFRQYSGLIYLADCFATLKDVLEEKYKYVRADFFADEVHKGIGALFNNSKE